MKNKKSYFVHNKYVNKRKWQNKPVIQETLWSKEQSYIWAWILSTIIMRPAI